MDPAEFGLDPLGGGQGHLQALGNIGGDMVAAHAHTIGIDHVFFHENRNAGRAAPHVDTGGPQFLLIFNETGFTRDIGRRRHACQFQIAALDAVDQILNNRRIDRQQVQVTGKAIADLAARIAQTRAVVEREVHRLGVQHFAPRADIGHITGGQNPRDILFGHDRVLQFPLARQAIAARLCPRKTGDHMVYAHIGHFLRRLDGGADGAFGLVHHRDLAKAHPA